LGIVVYRLQGVEVSECEGLTALLKVVDDSETIGNSDDLEDYHSRVDLDSDGWTASSVVSYPYSDDEELDIPAQEQGDENDVVNRDSDDEVIPSSQGSSEFFYR
jgi:hypothetical protein